MPPRIPAVVEPPEAGLGGLTANQLEEACRLIGVAQRPVIYAGGIISANCADLLLQLAE